MQTREMDLTESFYPVNKIFREISSELMCKFWATVRSGLGCPWTRLNQFKYSYEDPVEVRSVQ